MMSRVSTLLLSALVGALLSHHGIAVAEVKATCTSAELGHAAKKLLSSVTPETRTRLRKYHFKEGDPLSVLQTIEQAARKHAPSAAHRLLACKSADHSFTGMMHDPEWGPRAVILAAAQLARGEDIQLVEPLVGHHLEDLISRPVSDLLPVGCNPQAPATSADYNADADRTWYRWRALMWTRCSNGAFLAYLPESGWLPATAAQIDAIKVSNPGKDD